MMRMIYCCSFGRFLVMCAALAVMPAALAQPFPAQVGQALARAGIGLDAVGIHVQQVDSDKVLVSANPDLPLNPASTMKLVTTNAALDLLGPAFTWQTQAYASGVQSGDILHGDLIIKGGGDPKLVLENFWLFLRQIRARGIREIRGNLVLDRSLFPETDHDPSKFDGDPTRPYNAGPDALLVNYRTFNFRFMPNPALGLVSVTVDPPVTGYPVIAPKLGSGECGDWRPKLLMTQDATTVDFAGAYPAACEEKIWQVHAWKMTSARYVEIMFRRLWTDLGGSLAGQVRDGITPADARLVAQWDSVSLGEVVRDINKFSNNVMARQLLLTLAAKFSGQPATTEAGGQVIKTWLMSRQRAIPELVIENGAGLSRDERISAAGMSRLLAAAYRSPVMSEFMSSLPVAGRDGTMRSRLNGLAVAGNAHIKTGFLTEVRAIAGYVLAASGKRYTVVCIINHANAVSGRDAQDMLLQWIYENG